MNLLIFTAFFIIAGITVLSFNIIENMTTEIVNENVEVAVTNSRTLRELSKVFADIDLLSLSYTKKNFLSKAENTRLAGRMNKIAQNAANPNVKQALLVFSDHLKSFLSQCVRVNRAFYAQKSSFDKAMAELDRLEKYIGDFLVRSTLLDQETSFAEQLLSLTVGYRESLLKISKKIAESSNETDLEPLGNDKSPVITGVDELLLRLQTITASTPEISNYGQKILNHIHKLKESILKFYNETRELNVRSEALADQKALAMSGLEDIDNYISKTSERVNDDIKKTIIISEATVALLSAMVIVFLGFTKAYFVKQYIKKPVNEILGCVKSIGEGNFNIEVNLNGKDEWNNIKRAIRNMAADLKTKTTSIKELNLEINERKLLEKKLAQHSNELSDSNKLLVQEAQAHKRTAIDLARSKDAAEVASKAKSLFLAMMSHELRTPLSHIIGYTQLVVRKHVGELNERQSEYLNDVLTSSGHLLDLINDILDLSRMEYDRMDLKLSDVDLKMILENSLVTVKEKAIKHAIHLSIDTNDIPKDIRADESKLKQILYNLLANAVKFTPDGGEVHISACRQSGEQRHNPEPSHGCQKECIQVAVTDSGIGLKKDDLERIFNPFEQVENTMSRRYQGSGLGLAITKRFVELHSGRIWAESEGEGKGSTFRFIIPTEEK